MIYTKPIADINWEDVENFCEQKIPENAYLDYKENFPQNLYKSIAAFANTLGGLILIGVEEDNENKPVLPVKGINFDRGLSERIMNIILSNITPPVFPEIQIVTNYKGNSAIVIIRIPQSNQTPHAINNNTQVYIRTGNKNNPEKYANLDRIFWLNNQREKATNLKNSLINEAQKRFNDIYEKKINQPVNNEEAANRFTQGFFTLFLSPIYPENPFLSPPELNQRVTNFFVRDYFRTGEEFPISRHHRGSELFKNGSIVSLFLGDFIHYAEFNIFGLYFFRQILNWSFEQKKSSPIRIIRETEILSRLGEFLDSAIKFYENIGYNGLLQFTMKIDDIKDYPLGIFPGPELVTTIENEVEHSETILANLIADKKDSLILNKLKKVSWTFGLDIHENRYKEFLKKYKK
jgi:hypothetical protein